MRYKAVGFDYGGVIGGVHTTGLQFNDKVCQLLGISKDEYRSVYFSINDKIILGELSSWEEFWKLFLDKLRRPDQLDNIMKLNDEVERALQVVDTDMVHLVGRLRGLGYKTGLLSNTTLEGGNAIRKLGLEAHFDVFHISAETKRMKPNVDAFEHFVHALNVTPEQLVFIDDSKKMLVNAKAYGFVALQFKSYEKLVSDLRQLEVLPA